MALTFDQWRCHIDRVVADEGQWVGLLDEEGWPFLELPALVRLDAPKTRLAPASVECVVSVADGGRRVVEELVGDGLGRLDAVTRRLAPNDGSTRFLCVVRPGERLVFTVTHSVVEGGLVPSTLTVHGVDLLEGLAWWPCPSVPLVWKQHDFLTWVPANGGGSYVRKTVPTEFMEWSTDASGIPYKEKRRMAQVEMGRRADGYTVKAPARTAIRRLVQDSFDAVNVLMGWSGSPHAVVDFEQSPDDSPEVLIRGDDSSVWDTVSEPALQAGVNVGVDLWWPGDSPVRVRTSQPDKPITTVAKSWQVPMQIVRVR